MENSKRYSLSFDEIESKIEVDLEGLIFEIKNIKDKSYYENLENVDKDKIEEEIELILGKNSIKKINEMREKKGKESMTVGVETNLLLKLISYYTIETTKTMSNTMRETFENTDIKEMYRNRQQKRNYNRRYNRNNRRYY